MPRISPQPPRDPESPTPAELHALIQPLVAIVIDAVIARTGCTRAALRAELERMALDLARRD